MPILHKGRDTAHFMVSEATPGHLSREQIEITGPAYAGQVLSDQTTTSGLELATCILWENIADGETAKRTVIARNAEVVGAALIYGASPDVAPTQAAVTAAHAALAAVGIVVREPAVPTNATA